MQGPSAASAAIGASPFARPPVWQPGWPWSTDYAYAWATVARLKTRQVVADTMIATTNPAQ
jgi:hypothetical protein